MAQKVQFIAAVLNRPELLILDEPFTGLDPVNAEVLKDAVLDLKKAGTTVVFSTHDMSVAERLCDRIFMIFKGRKVLDGTLDEIQSIYGYDTIRLRTEAGMAALDGLDGIDEINDQGNLQEVRWRGDPQELLAALMARTRIYHSRSPGRRCTTSSSGSPRPTEALAMEVACPCVLIFSKIWVVAVDRVRLGDPHQVVHRSGSCSCRSSWGRRSCFSSSWPSGWTPGRGSSRSSTARARSIRRSSRRPRHYNAQAVDARGKTVRPRIEPSSIEPAAAARAIRRWSSSSPTGSAAASSTPSSVIPAGAIEPPAAERRQAAGARVSLRQSQRRHPPQLADRRRSTARSARGGSAPPGIDQAAGRSAEPAAVARQPRAGRARALRRRGGAPRRSRRPRRSTRSARRSCRPCCMFIMFFVIMTSTPQLLNSVIEEKMSKISEVLLGSVTPFELMMGKLLGNAGIAMVLAALYVGGGYRGRGLLRLCRRRLARADGRAWRSSWSWPSCSTARSTWPWARRAAS